MADFRVGDVARASTILLTAGQTFTRTASRINGNDIEWSPTITDLGGGAYEASYNVNLPGTWTWYGRADDGTGWTITWSVEASFQPAGTGSPSGTSLMLLRRDVLKGLGDLVSLRATADGNDVTFVDTLNITAGDPAAYRGREVVFTSGQNITVKRYVTGSSPSQMSIGFGVPLPFPTQAGDTLDMVNTRGQGWKFQDAEEAINRAIRDAREAALLPTATVELGYAQGNGYVAIPDDFATIERVGYIDSNGFWRSINVSSRVGGPGWWVDRGQRRLYVTGRPAWYADGMTLRVDGLVTPAELVDDDDTTEIDSEWLTAQAQTYLLRQKLLRSPADQALAQALGILERQAFGLRAKITVRRSPWSVNL